MVAGQRHAEPVDVARRVHRAADEAPGGQRAGGRGRRGVVVRGGAGADDEVVVGGQRAVARLYPHHDVRRQGGRRGGNEHARRGIEAQPIYAGIGQFLLVGPGQRQVGALRIAEAVPRQAQREAVALRHRLVRDCIDHHRRLVGIGQRHTVGAGGVAVASRGNVVGAGRGVEHHPGILGGAVGVVVRGAGDEVAADVVDALDQRIGKLAGGPGALFAHDPGARAEGDAEPVDIASRLDRSGDGRRGRGESAGARRQRGAVIVGTGGEAQGIVAAGGRRRLGNLHVVGAGGQAVGAEQAVRAGDGLLAANRRAIRVVDRQLGVGAQTLHAGAQVGGRGHREAVPVLRIGVAEIVCIVRCRRAYSDDTCGGGRVAGQIRRRRADLAGQGERVVRLARHLQDMGVVDTARRQTIDRQALRGDARGIALGDHVTADVEQLDVGIRARTQARERQRHIDAIERSGSSRSELEIVVAVRHADEVGLRRRHRRGGAGGRDGGGGRGADVEAARRTRRIVVVGRPVGVSLQRQVVGSALGRRLQHVHVVGAGAQGGGEGLVFRAGGGAGGDERQRGGRRPGGRPLVQLDVGVGRHAGQAGIEDVVGGQRGRRQHEAVPVVGVDGGAVADGFGRHQRRRAHDQRFGRSEHIAGAVGRIRRGGAHGQAVAGRAGLGIDLEVIGAGGQVVEADRFRRAAGIGAVSQGRGAVGLH